MLPTMSWIFGTRSKLVTDFSQVGCLESEGDDKPSFDYIIIGGGTAGCVLASRLSENPHVKVLLLEAGGSGAQLEASRLPSGFTSLFASNSEYAWDLFTTPQTFAADVPRYWPRGKMLGGCSSMNAMMAQYGDPADFDSWANIIRDDAWAWKNFQPYFRKFEKYMPVAQSGVDMSLKGSDGPVKIGYFARLSKPSVSFIKACLSIGIPFIPDFNGNAGSVGVNQILTYIDERRVRVSSESAYLTRDVLARPNLKVAIHAHVTRIVFDSSSRAIGVRFASEVNRPIYFAGARKEVILSAGAIHSPQILLLSGVGPKSMLEQFNVPLTLDLPGVGSHLTDHPSLSLWLKDKSKSSPMFIRPDTLWGKIGLIFAKLQYFLFRRGPLTANHGEAAAFIRSDDPKLFPETEFPSKVEANTPSSTSPDLEILVSGLRFPDPRSWSGSVLALGLLAILLRPLSKGTIGLKSSSPWDAPLIDPRYLESQYDVDRLVRATKLAIRIVRTEPLASFVDPDYEHPNLRGQWYLKTDTELEEAIRAGITTLYHPTSTCRMAPLEENGVVDSQLRVYGIKGLRVCDASVFPSIVSGHTVGATFAVAEKLSDLLR